MAQRLRSSSRVLVADSDPLTRNQLTAIIRKEGYEVVAVNDGREASRVLESDADFRLAIFDMAMPHVSGPDVVRHMKTDERLINIPVVMITSDLGVKLMNDSFVAGAAVFLFKPITTIKLQHILRMFLNWPGRSKGFAVRPSAELN